MRDLYACDVDILTFLAEHGVIEKTGATTVNGLSRGNRQRLLTQNLISFVFKMQDI